MAVQLLFFGMLLLVGADDSFEQWEPSLTKLMEKVYGPQEFGQIS